MNLMHVPTEAGFKNFSHTTVEDLVTSHFNWVFKMMNVFVEDPDICLQFTEGVFRALDDESDLTEKAVYRASVKQIRRIPQKRRFLDGVPHEVMLCWCLKETSDLRYAEIAGLAGLNKEQVKLNVAKVRHLLLA